MCGIAGMVALSGGAEIPMEAMRSMARAMIHRGPDEEGFWHEQGVGLASRRLKIIDLVDGRQPLCNEDGSVVVVYNGELFDHPQLREALEGRGHRFRTRSDTEVIPHLWEDHGEEMFARLRGQFALALWDRTRRRLILGRDRFGICPLYWTRQKIGGREWLLFGSEIKALLASGFVRAEPDLRGIHHVFNFLALPGKVTCFAGIELLLPGQYLSIQLDPARGAAEVETHRYWEIDFPDQGEEEKGQAPKRLVDEFERILLAAVERRLRADVPVVSYLSGGIDSSLVVALACKVLGRPVPTFTIKILERTLDETAQAAAVSRYLGTESVVVPCGEREVLDGYARLIRATEGPVVDTSCTALLLLAQAVHQRGFKVSLTGEGSDEWLAGYSWYKIHRVLGFFDRVPGLPLGQRGREYFFSSVLKTPEAYRQYVGRMEALSGGATAFHLFYGLMSVSRFRFFSPAMQESLRGHVPYEDLDVNWERLRRWHPLNRGLYWAGRIHLGGHLLSLKGDRVAMNSSVEVRYPYLDEEVFSFLARLHPRWKLRGLRDKYILRLLGERWLPKSTAWAPKGMFRAPLDSFFTGRPPRYVDQLLSRESLEKTGYFDADAVDHWRKALPQHRRGWCRSSIELGLVAVVATQLWHHLFIDDTLADTVEQQHPL